MSTRKRLISNFSSLFSVQVINYILPLITIPYLVRVLGPEKFGLIVFAQAFIQYFVFITEYGFNLSATRKISIMRKDERELSKIISSIFVIKAGLLILSFSILLGICSAITKFREDMLLYIISFGIVLGNTFFPVWFFQGMERMKNIAIFNIIGKSIFTIFIFVLVREKSDYLIVPGLQSTAQIIVAVIASCIMIKVYKIKLILPSLDNIISELKDGWHIFISIMASSLYTTTNSFILGIFTSNIAVGYYSAGEKIVKVFQQLMGPLWQTIYPHISKLVVGSKEQALSFVRKITTAVGISTFLISCALLVFAPRISDIVLGSQFKESIIIIQILSFLPFLTAMGNIFGTQVMLNFGYKKAFSRIIMAGSGINIFLAIILIRHFQHIGASLSMLITEAFITIILFIFIYSNGINVVCFRLPAEKLNRI